MQITRGNSPQPPGIHLRVKPSFQRPAGHFGACVALAVFALLLLAGCVISPRRIVTENPTPTPTPDISPTPTPTPTPGFTPTPTPAAAAVPQTAAQFLFLGDAGSPRIMGFRIDNDGGLAPLPGAPFAISAPARALLPLKNLLVIETGNGAAAYKVDKETGALERDDSATGALSAAELAQLAATRPQAAAMDAGGGFMYVVDSSRAALLAFRVENGKPLAAAVYTVPAGTSSVVVVRP